MFSVLTSKQNYNGCVVYKSVMKQGPMPCFSINQSGKNESQFPLVRLQFKGKRYGFNSQGSHCWNPLDKAV